MHHEEVLYFVPIIFWVVLLMNIRRLLFLLAEDPLRP